MVLPHAMNESVRRTTNVHVTVHEGGEVVETRDVHNTTTVGLDRLLSAALSPTTADRGVPEELAIGTGTQNTGYRDSQMSEPVTRVSIDEYETGEDYVICYGFLATNQGNVEDDIAECGLVSTEGDLLNHATFEPIRKHGGRVINFAVRIGYGPVQ